MVVMRVAHLALYSVASRVVTTAVCWAVYWVASMAMMTVATRDACWAERKAASTDVKWAALTAASMAGYSAARSAVCSVDLMDIVTAATRDAC